LSNHYCGKWAKSLLPSLYKREEFPLFGKEGSGEILKE
jgi:hypothetical protein